MIKWFLKCLFLLVASGLVACSSPGGRQVPSAPQPLIAPEHDPEYLIGPGDMVRVFVLGNTELSTEVPVRPDGKISTPLVSDIPAVGKTPSQLARDLENALQSYVRAPTVSVIISQATSAFSQVKVIGQAVTPRALPYRSGLRVLDVIVAVGGLSQFAAGNRAKIIRTEGGVTKQIKVKLSDLMNEGDTSQNLLMNPGDVLVVPEARF